MCWHWMSVGCRSNLVADPCVRVYTRNLLLLCGAGRDNWLQADLNMSYLTLFINSFYCKNVIYLSTKTHWVFWNDKLSFAGCPLISFLQVEGVFDCALSKKSSIQSLYQLIINLRAVEPSVSVHSTCLYFSRCSAYFVAYACACQKRVGHTIRLLLQCPDGYTWDQVLRYDCERLNWHVASSVRYNFGINCFVYLVWLSLPNLVKLLVA